MSAAAKGASSLFSISPLYNVSKHFLTTKKVFPNISKKLYHYSHRGARPPQKTKPAAFLPRAFAPSLRLGGGAISILLLFALADNRHGQNAILLELNSESRLLALKFLHLLAFWIFRARRLELA